MVARAEKRYLIFPELSKGTKMNQTYENCRFEIWGIQI